MRCVLLGTARIRIPRQNGRVDHTTFKLITTMRRGSAAGIAAAWECYPTLAAARAGVATLLRDERVLRVMIVRNEIPTAFVEWVER